MSRSFQSRVRVAPGAVGARYEGVTILREPYRSRGWLTAKWIGFLSKDLGCTPVQFHRLVYWFKREHLFVSIGRESGLSIDQAQNEFANLVLNIGVADGYLADKRQVPFDDVLAYREAVDSLCQALRLNPWNVSVDTDTGEVLAVLFEDQ